MNHEEMLLVLLIYLLYMRVSKSEQKKNCFTILILRESNEDYRY